MRLEDVTPGAQITGIIGDAPVTVVAAAWIGGNALRLTYRTENAKLDERILYRDHESRLDAVKRAAYDLTADAGTFKLAAEARGGLGLILRPPGAARGPSFADLRLRIAPYAATAVLRRVRIEVLRWHGGKEGQTLIVEIDDETGSLRVPAELAPAAARA